MYIEFIKEEHETEGVAYGINTNEIVLYNVNITHTKNYINLHTKSCNINIYGSKDDILQIVRDFKRAIFLTNTSESLFHCIKLPKDVRISLYDFSL